MSGPSVSAVRSSTSSAGVSVMPHHYRRACTPLLPQVRRPVRCHGLASQKTGSHSLFASRLFPRNARLFLETITDAVQRLNHIEIVVTRLELLAQPFDVTVDGAIVDIDLIVI